MKYRQEEEEQAFLDICIGHQTTTVLIKHEYIGGTGTANRLSPHPLRTAMSNNNTVQ